MTVLGGLQFPGPSFENRIMLVSIPMTVLGGLQFEKLDTKYAKKICFNTDDGIRRAAIPS